jgi:glutathione synthase/RimK-type ligase-like ATP-grasp enzyme
MISKSNFCRLHPERFQYIRDEHLDSPLRVEIIREVCERMEWRLETLQSGEGFLCRIWNGSRFINHQTRICTVNSYSSAKIAQDKVFTYLLLQRAGIRVPSGAYYLRENLALKGTFNGEDEKVRLFRDAVMLGMNCSQEQAKIYLSTNSSNLVFTTPLIVKPNSLSLGKGFSIVTSFDQLKPAIDKVFSVDSAFERIVIIQEYVGGDEFRLIMLDGELVLCFEKQVLSTQPPTITPVDKTSEVGQGFIDMAKRICEETQLRYAGIDLRCGSVSASASDAIVLEVNGNPGMNSFYLNGNNKERVFSIYQRLFEIMFAEQRLH